MTTFRERRVDGPGDREHVLSLLVREARRDQRTAQERRLDHEAAAREAADHSVSPREVGCYRCSAQRKFRDHAAALRERVRELAIARGIHDVEAGADDRDAARLTRETAAMCRCVDAER